MSSPVPMPNQAGPGLVRPKTGLWYISLACGALPLGIGCLITGLFLLTRVRILGFAGFLTILGGFAAFVMGFGCWIAYARDAKRNASVPSRRLNLQRAFTISLLLLNFPVAVGCIAAATWAANRFTVTVKNEGTGTIDTAVVLYDGRNHDLGAIGIRKSRSKSFSLTGNSLQFSAIRNGRMLRGEGVDHMDSDQFYDFTFRVQDDAVIVERDSKYGL